MAEVVFHRRNVRQFLILANIACFFLVALVVWFESSRSTAQGPLSPASAAVSSETRRDAFVTLLTDSSYLPGAIVLAKTLKNTNTSKNLVCIVTPDVSESDRITLKQYGWTQVVEVDPISNTFPTQVGKFQGGKVMSKIAVFNLTEIADVIVFIDSDSMVRRNIDNLFDRCPNFCAPVVTLDKIYGGGYFYFNSGLMVLRPNKDLFKSILAFANTPEIPNPDKADMGLLNRFFYFECQNLINHPIPTTSDGRIRHDLVPKFTSIEGQDEFIPHNLSIKSNANNELSASDRHCMGLTYDYQVPGWQNSYKAHAVIHFLGSFKPWACFTDPDRNYSKIRCAKPYQYEQIFMDLFLQIVPDVKAFADRRRSS